ncbi:MAG: PadR family transcriptional regulator [Gaiellaceae bacterium]
MARVFKRGELKQAIVAVLAALGEAHGYAIMGELKERVGGRWKPSPGAIYPALLSLEELGMVTSVDDEGTKVYSLTDEGRRVAQAATGAWAALAERAADASTRTSVGSLIDDFASSFSERRKLVDGKQQAAVERVLSRAAKEIMQTLEKGEKSG